jgi:hypothetical protein
MSDLAAAKERALRSEIASLKGRLRRSAVPHIVANLGLADTLLQELLESGAYRPEDTAMIHAAVQKVSDSLLALGAVLPSTNWLEAPTVNKGNDSDGRSW